MLKDFRGHKHIFSDEQQQQQQQRRGTKRGRSDDDDESANSNDDGVGTEAVQSPPLKVLRLGGVEFRLLNYGLRIDRSGIRFHAKADVFEDET